MTASMFSGGGSGLAGDLDMFRQALNNDWPISPEVKKMYMDLAATIAAHGRVKNADGDIQKATVRDRLSAIKVALLAERLKLLTLQESHREIMHQHLHLHQHGEAEGVRILEEDDWYDNHERLNTTTLESTNESAPEPSEIQDRKLRSEMGQNGDGAHSNGERPRDSKGRFKRPD